MAKRKNSPGTQAMMENFMDLHQQNFSISEIAEKYGITPCTVYSHLQSIADMNNVSRDFLLNRPYANVGPRSSQQPFASFALYEARDSISSTINKLNGIITNIEAILSNT